MTTFEKWLVMVLICLAGSIVYWGPFFADIFYDPMQEAFGFSNMQIGVLTSVFGTTSMIAYFPGGWVADRFSSRKLISVSLFICAVFGFVFWTIPSFEVCLVIFAVWGLVIALMLWSSMIKAIRHWGSESEQGRAFGFLEGGRNISDSASTALLLALFAFAGADYGAVRDVILAQTVAVLLTGVLVWFYLEDDEKLEQGSNDSQSTFKLAQVKDVLKLPMVWLIAVIIMAAYYGYWGSYYFAAYATKVLEMSDVLGGAVGGSKYWMAPFAAIAAGFIADKVGIAKAVVWSFVLMTAGFLLFGFVPGGPALVPIMLVNVGLVSIAVFALRGIYFALMEQGSIPIAVTGTAVGFVSVIGYTPDIFAPLFAGYLLDTYPGAQGFQYYYLIIGGFSTIGLIASYHVYRTIAAAAATAEN
jgi:sugar phosphate permease